MSAVDVMIVAGEDSGDLHGARLIKAMGELADIRVCGMGGSELKAQGMTALFDSSRLAVVGLSEVWNHLGDIRAALNILTERLKALKPAVLILIDYPDFNLILAGRAARLGIPIFYYISPQVWAWRSGRIKKIKKLVDRMAVILPFEKDFYLSHGMAVDFVGHPLLDTVRVKKRRDDFLKGHGIDARGRRIIGLLPGSRKKEIAVMLPIFLESAEHLARQQKDLLFLLPMASSVTLEELNNCGLAEARVEVIPLSGDRYDLMAACDAVVAASGTVTLELAILKVPMIVSYRVSRFSYEIIKRLTKARYISLVNLIAEREVVPELVQDRAGPEEISRGLSELLTDSNKRITMQKGLAQVVDRLGGEGASRRAAALALKVARRFV